jgi:hypothetical protein
MKFLLFLACLVPAGAESLHYAIYWPSGLSLGEASWSASPRQEESDGSTHAAWEFSLDIDASMPGFTILDRYHSSDNADLCALEIDKKYQHGTRKADERTTIDQSNHTATRGAREGIAGAPFPVASCARDPLAFFQYVRNELAQGRLPASQSLVFGSIYEVRLTNTGVEQVRIGGKTVSADHIAATIKGPATDATFEMLFAQDAVRTPVLFRIPLSLGVFTAELAH